MLQSRRFRGKSGERGRGGLAPGSSYSIQGLSSTAVKGWADNPLAMAYGVWVERGKGCPTALSLEHPAKVRWDVPAMRVLICWSETASQYHELVGQRRVATPKAKSNREVVRPMSSGPQRITNGLDNVCIMTSLVRLKLSP